jgi:hypothetical protein
MRNPESVVFHMEIVLLKMSCLFVANHTRRVEIEGSVLVQSLHRTGPFSKRTPMDHSLNVLSSLEQVAAQEAALRCHIAPTRCCVLDNAGKPIVEVDYDFSGLSALEQAAGLVFVMSAWPGLPSCAVHGPAGTLFFCAAHPQDAAFESARANAQALIRGPYLPYIAQCHPDTAVFWASQLQGLVCRIWVRVDSLNAVQEAIQRMAAHAQPRDFEDNALQEGVCWRVWRKRVTAPKLEIQPLAAWEQRMVEGFQFFVQHDDEARVLSHLVQAVLAAGDSEDEFSVWGAVPPSPEKSRLYARALPRFWDLLKAHRQELVLARRVQRGLLATLQGHVQELADSCSTLAPETQFPAALSLYLSLLTGYHIPVWRVMGPAPVLGQDSLCLIVEVGVFDDRLNATTHVLVALQRQRGAAHLVAECGLRLIETRPANVGGSFLRPRGAGVGMKNPPGKSLGGLEINRNCYRPTSSIWF